MQTADSALLDLARPEVFHTGDPANVLVAAQRRFGQLCAALADHGFPDAGAMSVFDFESAVDYVLEKLKPKG